MSRQQNTFVAWIALALMGVAGAWTLFHLIWNIAVQTSDDQRGIALLVLFVLALLLAFVRFFQERPILTAVSSTERFPEPALARFFLASEGSAAIWFVVRIEVGSEWLLAGWEKMQSPAWGTSGKGIAGFVAGALAKASGPNPAVQGWYAWFLQHAVQPNAGLFSFLVTYREFAVGLGVLLGVLTGIAAGFGVLMNLNYLLAGTVCINPILGVFGLFLLFSWRVCGWMGGDRWLLPALGLPWNRLSRSNHNGRFSHNDSSFNSRIALMTSCTIVAWSPAASSNRRPLFLPLPQARKEYNHNGSAKKEGSSLAA